MKDGAALLTVNRGRPVCNGRKVLGPDGLPPAEAIAGRRDAWSEGKEKLCFEKNGPVTGSEDQGGQV